MEDKLKVLSLYSGAGGIDLGFHKSGFETVYAIDNWGQACQTLVENGISKIVECKDVREIDFKEKLRSLDIERIDCVVGGPPCPPYSKSRFYLKNKRRALEDEKAFTLREYFRAIEEVKPKMFFFENVHGFVYKPHIEAFAYLQNRSSELGYKITYKIVNAAFYGVPQIRQRFICIGVNNELPGFIFPRETHFNPSKYNPIRDRGKKPWGCCRDAIGDLDVDLPEDVNMQAGSKHKDLLKLVPPGDNYLYFTEKRGYPNPAFKWRSRYWSFLLKLSPDKPSWTIQASHSNNMGPFHWKNRFLRISEIKRIQTFDDNYEITGGYRSQWAQVGNAVPPLLVKVIAESMKKQLLKGSIDYQLEF